MKAYIIFTLLLTSLFMTTASFGETFEVYEGESIQDAISLAEAGDTILVNPGTYVENINFMGKNISVISSNGPEVTIIDGDRNGSVATFENGESSFALLSGFTLTNGEGATHPMFTSGGVTCFFSSSPSLENLIITGNSAISGAGVYCYDNSGPYLQDVVISNNTSFHHGGGIFCNNFSSPSLVNVTISENEAAFLGGGMYCYANSSPSLINATIIGNSADSGGGIRCNMSSPTIENVTISGNTAATGGGIVCDFQSNLSLTDVTISDNTASNGGGGICCWELSNPSLENVIISDNIASYGGGIYCRRSSEPNIMNVTITGNTANEDGGGIYCDYYSRSNLNNVTISGNTANSDSGYGGGMYLNLFSNTDMINVTISENVASSGAGIYSQFSAVNVENGAFLNNTAENDGGGIFLRGNRRIYLKNVMISGNTAARGGGMYFWSAVPYFENVTISSNTASEFGGGIFGINSVFMNLLNTIFWENSPHEFYFSEEEGASFVSASWSDIRGGVEGIVTNENCTIEWLDGNIDQAPLFVDAENGDFHLTTESPCIDAGNPDPEYDDGCFPPGQSLETNDMGAYGGPGNCGWLYLISGSVNYWHDDMSVPDALLTITGDDSYETNSDSAGIYTITGIQGGDYTLLAAKLGDAYGVQAYDAARVLQYSSGLFEFNEYQILAADVTGDGDVTPLDAAKIGQYAAELEHDSRAGQWTFLPEEYIYTPLDDYLFDQSFTAILYGEVTGNWSHDASNDSLESCASFQIPDVTTNLNDLATIPVLLKSGDDLIALEGIIQFDPDAFQFVKGVAGKAAQKWNITTSSDNTTGKVRFAAYGAFPAKEDNAICNFIFKIIGKRGAKIEFTEILGNNKPALMNSTSIIKKGSASGAFFKN